MQIPHLWQILERVRLSKRLINFIKSLYKQNPIAINTGASLSEEILTTQGVRWSCSLSFSVHISAILQEHKNKSKFWTNHQQ